MDTLTHALSGAVLARLLVVRPALGAAASDAGRGPGASAGPAPTPLSPFAAMAVGALAGAFPDIDAVAQLAGDLAYLRHHRGVTHSLLMAPLWALGLAWLCARVMAWRRSRRPGAAAAPGWRALYPLVLGAILIHIAGDWITQFGTMLLAPLSDARFGLGAVFIIDLAVTGMLLAGLLLAIALPRARWPAALALAGVTAWVGLAHTGRGEAVEAGQAWAQARGIVPQAVEVMPRPASPFNWTVVVDDGSRYHVAHLNTRRTEPLLATPDDHFIRRFSAPYLPRAQAAWTSVPRFGEAPPPWVRQAWEHEAFTIYRWFSLTPALLKTVEQAGPGGRPERCAFFRDLRFEFPGRDEPPFRYGVCLDAADPRQARVLRLEDGRQVEV